MRVDSGAATFPFLPALPVDPGNAANIAPNLMLRESEERKPTNCASVRKEKIKNKVDVLSREGGADVQK